MRSCAGGDRIPGPERTASLGPKERRERPAGRRRADPRVHLRLAALRLVLAGRDPAGRTLAGGGLPQRVGGVAAAASRARRGSRWPRIIDGCREKTPS